MTTRRWVMSVFVAVAVLLIVGRSLAGLYSDYLWYEALGAGALWRVRMTSVATMRLGSGVVAGLFAFINLYAVRQSVVSLVLPRRLGNLEIGEEVPGRFLLGATAALAVILGVLLAMPSDNWTSFALAWTHRPFNETDPYLSQDLGFFVYWLPFESLAWMFMFFVVLVTALAVVLLYALTPSLKWQRGSLYASAYVRRHMTMLVGAILLLLAWSFRLDMYGLLVDGSGADHAFTWVDHHISVTADLVLSIGALSGGLIVLWAGYVGRLRLAAIAVMGVVGLALIGRQIAPLVFTHSGTDEQRASRERPYLATRATYTRRAFDVDRIGHADSTVAFPSLATALPSLPMWDPPALVRALSAGRAAGDYPMLIGWRAASGGLVADVVDSPAGNATARAPWNASRVVASDADERGAPIRLTALSGFGDDTPIDAPIVYPNAPATLVTADSLTHVAGTLLESFPARLATAWSTQNFRLLVDDLAQPHPTLVSHRDVRDRLDMYAPFFAQGRHVDPILLGDSLYWAVDLYSVTDSYPLSAHFHIVGEDRAFFHHAAVAIVQASTGDVMMVPDSVSDPIAESWKSQVPSLFTTWGALPPGIRAQLDPPIDGVFAQAIAFGRFGTRGEGDVAPRELPARDGSDTAVVSDVLPLVLPGGKITALAIPLVDLSERLRGVIIGTNSAGGHSVAWMPLDTPGARWTNMLDHLRSIDSANVGTRDGQLVHGRVRVVPLRSGIALVQPTYRWHGPGAPTLSRVLVLSGDSLRSIAPPLSGATVAPAVAGTTSASDFRGSITRLYDAMREALRRGDFVAFGRAFEQLGKALDAGKP